MVYNSTLVLLVFFHLSALSNFYLLIFFFALTVHMPTVNALTLSQTLSSSETNSISGLSCVRLCYVRMS